MKRIHKAVAITLLSGVALIGINYTPVAYGSVFGEENVTLVQILVQMLQAKEQLEELNEAADLTADLTGELVDNYQRLMAGVDEVKSYSWDAFRRDVRDDFYAQYPGIAKLEGASRRLKHWDEARSASPFTAYQAITAAVDDLSAPLREDIAKGKVNVDEEIILATEAALGLADATAMLAALEGLNEQGRELEALYEKNKGPASAQMVTASTNLLLAKQNSHILRLLGRSVTLSSVDRALEYGRRMRAKDTHKERAPMSRFMKQALTPPTLINFGRR